MIIIKNDQMIISYKGVIKFWFEEIKLEQIWTEDFKFDVLIAQKFGDIHEKATRCALTLET